MTSLRNTLGDTANGSLLMGELQKNQLDAIAISLPLMNSLQISLPRQCCFKRKIHTRCPAAINLLQHQPPRPPSGQFRRKRREAGSDEISIDKGGYAYFNRQVLAGKRGFAGTIRPGDDDDAFLIAAPFSHSNPPIISRIRSVTCLSSASITSKGRGGVNT